LHGVQAGIFYPVDGTESRHHREEQPIAALDDQIKGVGRYLFGHRFDR